MTVIRRMFFHVDKAFSTVVLAVLFPILAACGPPPDEALLRQAKSGDPAAQSSLAQAYSDLQQYEKAVHWWKQAAEQGHSPAQVDLGLMYQVGVGGPRDLAAARRWYLAAAGQGNASGLHNLAYLYRRGDGVELDASQAAAWYLQAAQQGLSESMVELGEMYAAGEGVPKDQARALSWWRKAASHGAAGGWVRLADAHARGDGVPVDLELAYAMLQRAETAGPEGMAVHWYEQIEIQKESFSTPGSGHFTLMERAKELEREGRLDDALVEPTWEQRK